MFLGISDAQTDAGVALVDNGRIICAVNEERFTRTKIQGGFPHKALKYILNSYKNESKHIEGIAIAGINTPPLLSRRLRFLQKLKFSINYPRRHSFKDFLVDLADFRLQVTYNKTVSKSHIRNIKKQLRQHLPSRLQNKKMILVDHHYAHACAAYYRSPFQDTLVASFDGNGDGYSAKIYSVHKGEFQQVYSCKALDSLGEYYSLITVYLGFKAHKHEGKITGLAAFGNAENVKETFPFTFTKKGKLQYRSLFGLRGLDHLKTFNRYRKEDIAAWLQEHTEKFISLSIRRQLHKTNHRNLCLVGGLFANVKINQKLHELPEVQNIFIYPAMGDMGLADGAACAFERKQNTINAVYFGPEYTGEQVIRVLKKYGLRYTREKNIELIIAHLLKEQKIIARYTGRMEYGPRALGNRSILASAVDSSINDKLNKQLKRTEFMPFAPSILREHAKNCIVGLEGAELTASFMNIAFTVTPFMKQACPAAVHIDDTCRPQLVSQEQNQSFYSIIKEYYKLTGIPAIINTSFNIHEEPIVMTPEDAVHGFLKAKLDYLAIGNLLIRKKE
jgi:carbamoyltransferase